MTPHFLFIFLDGFGLGPDDPDTNPLARAELPTINAILGGRRLVISSAPYHGAEASLLALDACLGVPGLPQSATGQATLLTGINISREIGYHYGPKPNPEVAKLLLSNGNLFNRLQGAGLRAELLNAYPPGYFSAIESGRRMYSAIPLAVTNAGIQLKNQADLAAGLALAADFTAIGWRTHLGLQDTPGLSIPEAGHQLGRLAYGLDFAFFEYWLSDYAGHHQDWEAAMSLLQKFDGMLSALLEKWNPKEGLVLVTSDHGNLEDLSTRRHTYNPVPALVLGAPELRNAFCQGLQSIQDIAPGIINFFHLPLDDPE